MERMVEKFGKAKMALMSETTDHNKTKIGFTIIINGLTRN